MSVGRGNLKAKTILRMMKMNNLELYDKVRAVPDEAQKKITGGRLSGKTDINPMWRIKALTENFGTCGVGWKMPIKRLWLEPGANGEVAAFCEVELFIKINGEWSDGITGIGGSSFVANEKSGQYTSDECYKMAYTDAISVACKMLGFGADIYWDKDKTKYDSPAPSETFVCGQCEGVIESFGGRTPQSIIVGTTKLTGTPMCAACFKKWEEENKKEG